MTAISTFILNYKEKYPSINRIYIPGGKDEESDKIDKTGQDPTKENKNWQDVTTSITTAANAIAEYKSVIAELNSGLIQSYKQQQKLVTEVTAFAETTTFFEEREKNLIKTFKVGTATLMHRTLAYSSLRTKLKATNDEMVQYRATMETAAPLTAKMFADIEASEDTRDAKAKNYLETQARSYRYLEQNTSLTQQQQADLAGYAASQGKNIGQVIAGVQAMSEAYGAAIDPAETVDIIFEGLANTSADVVAHYSKMPGNLDSTILKSKKLGVSMDQLHKIGEGMLDIETSVGKELEYQLLSGQRLEKNGKSITNAFREATIMGDADKSLQALNDVFDTQKTVLEGTNFAAKKSLAENLGMSTKELQLMYQKKKLSEQINDELKDSGKEYDLNKMDDEAKKKLIIELESKTDDNSKLLLDKLTKLNENEKRNESPAVTITKQLQSIMDDGLDVYMMTNGKYIKEDAEKKRIEARKSAVRMATATTGSMEVYQNEKVVKLSGAADVDARKRKIARQPVEDISKLNPLLKTLTTTVMSAFDKVVNITLPEPMDVDAKVVYIKGPTEIIDSKENRARGGILTETKYATGGVLFGPSHARGGIPTRFGELEGGEAIINKKSTQKYAPLLSKINEAEGGVKFANGGVTNTTNKNQTIRSNVNYITNNVISQTSTNLEKQIAVLANEITKLHSNTDKGKTQSNTTDIVSSITKAISNLKLDVHVTVDPLDPMKIKKEMAFRANNLNTVTYKK